MALIWSKIIQKLVNAISFKNTTKKEDNDPPPVPRSELYIPQSVIDCYYAGQRENKRRVAKLLTQADRSLLSPC